MDIKLDPSRDDLPLMANTSHILVKHYVLDLDVDFESQVIEGTIVLFLESGNRFKKRTQDQRPHLSQDGSPGQRRPGWGGTRWLGSTMVELETSQALHQPCALQRPPCLSQQVTQFTHSPTGP